MKKKACPVINTVDVNVCWCASPARCAVVQVVLLFEKNELNIGFNDIRLCHTVYIIE